MVMGVVFFGIAFVLYRGVALKFFIILVR